VAGYAAPPHTERIVLLLVLILVLLAFGLLVVALLSGSVLWAWVSVGVSVAAAAVLLVDWLQRRNAVKAGAVAAGGNGTESGMPDIEPVTEVLPVISASGDAGQGGSAVNGAAQGVSDDRFDRSMDGTQTVVMPAVQPSGSGERPSSATGGISPSSSNPSLSVTKSGGDQFSSTPLSSDSTATGNAGSGTSPEPAQAAGGSPATPPPAVKDAGQAPVRESAAAGASSAPAGPPERDSANEDSANNDSANKGSTGTGEVQDTKPGGPTPAAAGAAKPTDTSALESTMAMNATQAATSAPAVPEHGPADQPPAERATPGTAADARTGADSAPAEKAATAGVPEDSSGPVDVGPTVALAGDSATASAAADEGKAAGPADTAATGAPESTAGESVPAESTIPATDADAEPPEEPPDVAASALVAALDDEVVVVDEQPRYHVEGCRALAGKALIPLPAREAIELGFTPCGWCTPDRTLASRHPAPTR
jgi:hypothetical protein